MNENEFSVANPSLQNEVKLTCSVEEAPTGKRIRMEFRNQTSGSMNLNLQLLDGHLNYTISSKDEADRLISYLIGLANQL